MNCKNVGLAALVAAALFASGSASAKENKRIDKGVATLKAAPAPEKVDGVITSIDGTLISVDKKKLSLGRETSLTLNGAAVAAKDLKVGDSVAATFVGANATVIAATRRESPAVARVGKKSADDACLKDPPTPPGSGKYWTSGCTTHAEHNACCKGCHECTGCTGDHNSNAKCCCYASE